MDDFLEQVASRRRKGIYTVAYVFCWIGIIISGLMAAISLSSILGVNPETGSLQFSLISLIWAVVNGGVAFLLWRASDFCQVEYDYTFTNGTLDVSRVLNNRRRKYLTALDTKTVVRCGPAQGPVFMKTLNEKDVKKHNWFVNRDAKLYFFFFEKNGVKHIIVLELTDEMVELMRSKSNYLPRTSWYEADGTQKINYGA